MRATAIAKSSNAEPSCYVGSLMVTRRRTRVPKETSPTLTVHQIVAYNFTRARQQAGWTQSETGEQLEPYLGYRLNQAGVSAIEKTYDTERRRNIDAAEVVAFARCFDRPIGWFFLPPTGHASDLIEPVRPDERGLEVSYLTSLVLGTPPGWRSFLDRVAELLETDHRDTWDAVLWATHGVNDAAQWEQQIDLRRRAIEQVTLARLAGPEDAVITNMAQLLVQLAKLTPIGFNKLRDADPDEALALLAKATSSWRSSPRTPSAGGGPDEQVVAALTTSDQSNQRRHSASVSRNDRSQHRLRVGSIGHMSVILDISMSASVDIEAVIPGARGRVLCALVRLDGPRTISEVARLADVSRDQAATIVADLERLGLVERKHAGRAHLVTLVDEHPVTQSLREIERARERSIDALRQSARQIEPAPAFMALYGSWARGEDTEDSDLDVAVIADAQDDRDVLLESLDAWSRFARRVTGRTPSVVIADGLRRARGPLWTSVRRDAIILVDRAGTEHDP
jgi:predicted nucleotidyltransferase